MIQAAAQNHGVIVSNDKFRDILSKLSSSNDFLQHQTITERVLQFVYHEGSFMFPDDPYGRKGPSLDQLLSFWENEQKTENCMHKNSTIICKYENSTCDVILSKLEYYICHCKRSTIYE